MTLPLIHWRVPKMNNSRLTPQPWLWGRIPHTELNTEYIKQQIKYLFLTTTHSSPQCTHYLHPGLQSHCAFKKTNINKNKQQTTWKHDFFKSKKKHEFAQLKLSLQTSRLSGQAWTRLILQLFTYLFTSLLLHKLQQVINTHTQDTYERINNVFVNNKLNNFHCVSCTSVKVLHPAWGSDNETQGGAFRAYTRALIFLSSFISGAIFSIPLDDTWFAHPHIKS